MRADALAARTVSEPEAYQEYAKLAMEVADVLRKNIVQAAKVSDASKDGEDKETWSEFRCHPGAEEKANSFGAGLRITKDTELGSNETIRNPPVVEKSPRSMRKREKKDQQHQTCVHLLILLAFHRSHGIPG
jgi:hypothetical protein